MAVFLSRYKAHLGIASLAFGMASKEGAAVPEPHHDVITAFADTASRNPDRTAMTHNGRSLTYAELDLWVRATARRLGPDPGVVGVVTSRSPATVAGLLGTLAAGGTYCPIDPAYPEPRRRALAAAGGCRLVITTGPETPVPPGTLPVRLPGLSEAARASGDTSGTAPVAFATGDPGDPAYVLFTSGSTGEPKPVVTPRGAIATAVGALRDLFGLTPADRVLQFASLNWDTCFEEILPTLTAGATLVFHDHAHSGSFRRMLRMLDAERVTVLDLPSAFWHELVRHLTEERATLPASVRMIVVGGEAVNPARLADWCALDTGAIRLVNTYGCTETTLVTHAVDLSGPLAASRPAPWSPGERVPIGHPLPHVLQHLGEEGELLVGGPSLALGYGGGPDANAERFVELDLGSGPERYFRTGDRVGRGADGMLVHEGRLDHELKVRGVRVDPAEVEAQIAGHPQVAAVAVAGVTVADHTTLAAYVVPRSPGGAVTLAEDVLNHLRDRSPAHLVPGRITVVPELVHTASGKVDRTGSHRRYASTT
ncbi:amino acid adenylation domain-containing protein [Streptosporangium sp. NPDC050855]|uniref:amino acid adenylation domain-containing protein n=1 Tax=Streptosporangium sp. NPDC050855 TaxID=3366194 RepID=UPI0037897738